MLTRSHILSALLLPLILFCASQAHAQKHLTYCFNFTAVNDTSPWVNAALTYDLEGTQVWMSQKFLYPFQIGADEGHCRMTMARGGPFAIPDGFDFQVVYGWGGWGGMTLSGVTWQDPTTLYQISPAKWAIQHTVPLLVPADTVWTKVDAPDDQSSQTGLFLFSKDYLAALGSPEGGWLALINVVNLTQFNNPNYPIVGCSGGAYVREQFTIFIMRTGADPTSPGQMITFKVSQQDGSILVNSAKIAYLGSEPQVSTAIQLPNSADVAIVWGQPVDDGAAGSVFAWSMRTANLFWSDVPFSATEAWTAITPVANALGEVVVTASDASSDSYAVCTYKSTIKGVNITSVCATEPYASAPSVSLAFAWEGDGGKVTTIGTQIGGVNVIMMYKWGFPGPVVALGGTTDDEQTAEAEATADEDGATARRESARGPWSKWHQVGPDHTTANVNAGDAVDASSASSSSSATPRIATLTATGDPPAVCMPACSCSNNPQVCGPTLSCTQSTCACQQDRKRRIFDCCP